MELWPGFIRTRFNYRVYSISFPSENAAEWKKLFKPCASQRLFLPVCFSYDYALSHKNHCGNSIMTLKICNSEVRCEIRIGSCNIHSTTQCFATIEEHTNITSDFVSLCQFTQLILKDIDSIMYVDSDILFLQPVDRLWALLSHFNSSQLAAMAPEHEEPRIAWYNRFARHPFYGRTGINSGVMLMNMTKMRSTFFKVVLKRKDTFTVMV